MSCFVLHLRETGPEAVAVVLCLATAFFAKHITYLCVCHRHSAAKHYLSLSACQICVCVRVHMHCLVTLAQPLA